MYASDNLSKKKLTSITFPNIMRGVVYMYVSTRTQTCNNVGCSCTQWPSQSYKQKPVFTGHPSAASCQATHDACKSITPVVNRTQMDIAVIATGLLSLPTTPTHAACKQSPFRRVCLAAALHGPAVTRVRLDLSGLPTDRSDI